MLRNKLLLIFILLINCIMFAQLDPNNNPNWDWRTETAYTLYPSGFALGTAIGPNSPFYQGGIGFGVHDNNPEDGWVLVMRDFGTPTRQTPLPYFILYNKYQGLLRVFVFIKTTDAFSTGSILLSPLNGYSSTVTPTFLENIAWGRNDIEKVKSRSSAAITPVIDNNWSYVDFPIAYDATIGTKANPTLKMKINGIDDFSISIDGLGTIQEVFGTKQAGNISSPGTLSAGETFNALTKSVSGTQDTWLKWQDIIKKIGEKIPETTTSESLLDLKNWTKTANETWTIGSLGLVGAGVGLVDFLLTGGRSVKKEQPSPMNFISNYKLNGTMKVSFDISGGITLPIPGGNNTMTLCPTNLLYTQPLGILNLKNSPVVQHRTYWWYDGQSNLQTHSYRIKDDLELELNPSSDLEIDKVEAAYVFEMADANWGQRFLSYVDQNGISPIDNSKIELESYNNSIYTFRTPYIDINRFKYSKITLPSGFNLYVKIKAILKVKNSTPDRQPVIFIAKYDANVEEGDGVNAPYSEPFSIARLRNYEFNSPEQLPTQYGYSGSQVVVNAPDNIGNYKFSGWKENLAYPNPYTVTINSNSSLTDIYKTINHSNNNTNYQKNGQRRFVQTPNGILHKVYESMGTVWYEQSTDHGATWTIANGGKPLAPSAKSPCIDNSVDDILIAYQLIDSYGHPGAIKVKYYECDYGTYNTKNEITKSQVLYADIYPQIAAKAGNGHLFSFLLTLNKESAGNIKIYLGNSYEVPDNGCNITLPDYPALNIERTRAINSTITCLKDINITQFHLVWEENGSIYYCPIYYNSGSNTPLTQGNIVDVSTGSGFMNNRQPSITVIKQQITIDKQINTLEDVKIMWIGDQYTTDPGGEELGKTLSGHGYITKALFRDNYCYNNGLVWSPYFSFGADVCGVNINSALSSNNNYYYLLGWSENNGAANKCINNSFVQINTIKQGTTNLTGKYLQICNGSNLAAQSIYASVFDESALPYQFKNSNSMNYTNTSTSSGGNSNAKETNSHGLSTSRGGVAFKGNAQFYFSLGDVLVNHNKINFVQLPDSINFNNLAEVNSLLSTEPFELNNNTPFSFSIQYGLTDSSAASALLSTGKNLNFKVVLYDVENNQILGEYDNVTYNSSNIYQYANVNNLVNTSGINYHKVVLKLVMSGNFDCSYSIAGSYSDDYALNKVGSKHIDLKNSNIVTEYGISQNYPNPFNPATTINYQLPANGMVTIKVYDILGNEIKTLVNEYKQAGRYNVIFDASKLSSGVYIYRIMAGDYTAAKKMTLVK